MIANLWKNNLLEDEVSTAGKIHMDFVTMQVTLARVDRARRDIKEKLNAIK